MSASRPRKTQDVATKFPSAEGGCTEFRGVSLSLSLSFPVTYFLLCTECVSTCFRDVRGSYREPRLRSIRPSFTSGEFTSSTYFPIASSRYLESLFKGPRRGDDSHNFLQMSLFLVEIGFRKFYQNTESCVSRHRLREERHFNYIGTADERETGKKTMLL